MNVLKKKAAVKKYGEAIKADFPAAEAQMKTDGYSDDEIAEVIEAVNNPEPDADAEKPAEKPKKGKVSGTGIYEKTQVRFIDGEMKKGDVLRKVKITAEQAGILNSQSHNTKVHYFESK